MFVLHDFVMKTIRKMVGKEPDYKVMQYCLKYLENDVLTEEDLAEVEALIDAQYPAEEEPTDESAEETSEETNT